MNRLPSNASDSSTPGENAKPSRVSLAGCLLASHPAVADSLFAHGVCLIVEQTDTATVGIMLNRPMAIDPHPFWNSLFQGAAPTDHPPLKHFNFGGPKNGPIVAIHNHSELAEGGNGQGVYVSAQVETLQKLAQAEPEHLRWIIGHATWGKSELEREIVDGKWLVVPAIPQIVFSDESQMWPAAIRWMGRSVIGSFEGVDHFPPTPISN